MNLILYLLGTLIICGIVYINFNYIALYIRGFSKCKHRTTKKVYKLVILDGKDEVLFEEICLNCNQVIQSIIT